MFDIPIREGALVIVPKGKSLELPIKSFLHTNRHFPKVNWLNITVVQIDALESSGLFGVEGRNEIKHIFFSPDLTEDEIIECREVIEATPTAEYTYPYCILRDFTDGSLRVMDLLWETA